MKSVLRPLLLSFLISAGVFTWFTWPLAVTPGTIPASARNLVPDDSPRHMWPGDHLQLMYHFWLFSDFFIGKTPFFENRYELNTGSDEERRWLHSYQFPFPLVYRPVAAIAGPAAGWNITMFISFWLTYFFTWLLLRRYVESEWLCALGALPAIVLPYRYVSVCGGSPAGFAMMWTPLVWLGLEMAVREKRVLGGVLAGVAILMGLFSDLHVFYFTGCFLPAMGLLALANLSQAGEPLDRTSLLRRGIALIPAGVGLLLAVAFAVYKKTLYARTAESFERGLSEVEQYSPDYLSFFLRGPEVYLGFLLVLLIAGGALLYAWRGDERRLPWLRWATIGLLLACVASSLWLAMGTNGPFDTNPARLARAWIPMFDRIRQPSKIFIYMPLWLSVLAGLSLSALVGRFHRRGLALAGATVLMGLVTFEFQRTLTMKLCGIDTEQEAYATMAQELGDRPGKLVILPLFHSARAESSVYLHYVSRYRLRMINGYSPIVPKGYTAKVIDPLNSMNYGMLTDEQRGRLKSMGVEYVVVHEDMFIRTVSHFPVAYTLDRFLHHSYLELVKPSGSVWAFRLLDEPRSHDKDLSLGIPAPLYAADAEDNYSSYQGMMVDGDYRAYGRGLIVLNDPGEHVLFPPALLYGKVPSLDGNLRLRGLGACRFRLMENEVTKFETELVVTNRNFAWFSMDLSGIEFAGEVVPEVAVTRGEVEVDYFKLGTYHTQELKPGDHLTIPALDTVHEGYSDLEQNAVVYRAATEPWGGSFKLPELAFPPGKYRVALDYEAPGVPAGTHVFNYYNVMAEQIDVHLEVHAGKPAELVIDNPLGMPMSFHIHYPRNSDLILRSWKITRIE